MANGLNVELDWIIIKKMLTWIAHVTFNESRITNLDGMIKTDSNLRDPNDNFQN